MDCYDGAGKMEEGEWRSITEIKGLNRLNNMRGQRYLEEAINMRISLLEFVNSEDGRVDWQEQIFTRTSY